MSFPQGFVISKDVLHDYLAYLEDAFLIQTIQIASASPRRQRVDPRKVHPADPGLIPVFHRSGRLNTGHALESVTFAELICRGASLHYLKTGYGFEIDFLVQYASGTCELIQVCSDVSDEATGRRRGQWLNF